MRHIFILFAKGNPALLAQPCAGVVGARDVSRHGASLSAQLKTLAAINRRGVVWKAGKVPADVVRLITKPDPVLAIPIATLVRRELHRDEYDPKANLELLYALGFDDRLDKLAAHADGDVADIIDLQTERQRVVRAQEALREGTTGRRTLVEDGPDVVHTPPRGPYGDSR